MLAREFITNATETDTRVRERNGIPITSIDDELLFTLRGWAVDIGAVACRTSDDLIRAVARRRIPDSLLLYQLTLDRILGSICK